MNIITGTLYRVSSNVKTKRNEEQPGKVSVSPSSVQKSMSSGGSGTTEVMAHQKTAGGRLFQARAHCHGKRTVAERRASGRPNHQSWRVSGPQVTAVVIGTP